MVHIQEPLLIIAAPVEIQAFIAMMFAFSATVLFLLALESGAYPTAGKYLKEVFSGDFWIGRQRRRWLFRTGLRAGCLEGRTVMRPRFI
jgi:hypothetical protein